MSMLQSTYSRTSVEGIAGRVRATASYRLSARRGRMVDASSQANGKVMTNDNVISVMSLID